jgi:hypothetical protein
MKKRQKTSLRLTTFRLLLMTGLAYISLLGGMAGDQRLLDLSRTFIEYLQHDY